MNHHEVAQALNPQENHQQGNKSNTHSPLGAATATSPKAAADSSVKAEADADSAPAATAPSYPPPGTPSSSPPPQARPASPSARAPHPALPTQPTLASSLRGGGRRRRNARSTSSPFRAWSSRPTTPGACLCRGRPSLLRRLLLRRFHHRQRPGPPRRRSAGSSSSPPWRGRQAGSVTGVRYASRKRKRNGFLAFFLREGKSGNGIWWWGWKGRGRRFYSLVGAWWPYLSDAGFGLFLSPPVSVMTRGFRSFLTWMWSRGKGCFLWWCATCD